MTDRTILHCDMNNFYASVECLYNPALRGKPVAVGGDVEARHGIILAKNYEAKKYGVQTGEALWQAKQKCPGLTIVPPSFEKYLRFSRLAREIYGCYTDRIESFGLDECWLDLTGSERLFGGGKAVADKLRERIKFELGVTISVGVSHNKIFAKLGSDMKKPDATTVITRENYKDVVWPLPVSDLLFVGPATTRKLARYGIHTIGQLAQADGRRMAGAAAGQKWPDALRLCKRPRLLARRRQRHSRHHQERGELHYCAARPRDGRGRETDHLYSVRVRRRTAARAGASVYDGTNQHPRQRTVPL